MNRVIFLLLLVFQAWPSTGIALPRRLVIALDGIAYRDMQALQVGVPYTNIWGGIHYRQAFSSSEGYFPVSRMISTFPSTSDVAWTDIFGNRPLPGYQRTYFSDAANSLISKNGVTTTVEHERQMDWQVESSFVRSMGYIYSAHVFEYEIRQMLKSFWNTGNTNANYYVYIRSSDDAQHLDRDIFSLLCLLDKQLQNLRARYKAKEGRDLQILILSDHGHNHAGSGQRVKIQDFLENAGYRVVESIVNSNDVVLPIAGIEDWVEVHNAPVETERLAERLTQLKGADIVAARLPNQTNRFLVLNSQDERAVIGWNPAKNKFSYSTEKGDPLHYDSVVEALKQKHLLDASGFATADVWMRATMTNRYPLALERIARGLTKVTLNPATILISLDNQYVNAGWLVKESSRLENYSSTHGALDDINSDGILLSNFKPTHDTSTGRVAGQFDGFPGMRNYRAEENGATWLTKKEQSLTRIVRDPFDRDYKLLSAGDVFLRIWSPQLIHLDNQTPVKVAIEKIPRFASAQIERGNPDPVDPPGLHLTFNHPISFPDKCAYERVYACPPDLILEPQTEYRISGWIEDKKKNVRLFEFVFHTNSRGRPAAF
jgi:Type I phosphodiesterase / nucleotide pyrophosphatase